MFPQFVQISTVMEVCCGLSFGVQTTEKEVMCKEKHVEEEASADEEIIYKIDVPANRYYLLCLEGLAMALRVFLLKDPIPTFRVSDVVRSALQKMVVKPELMCFIAI